MTAKKRQQKIVTDAIAYQKLFDSEDGNKVLDDLMRYTHMIGTTFSKDPHEMFYREGMRNVMLYILSKLQKDVLGLKQMIAERAEREKEYDAE